MQARSTTRRFVRATSAALLLTALLAACGSDDSNGGSSSGSPSDSTTQDDASPRRGGTLVYGLTDETPGGWCLTDTSLDTSGIIIERSMYEPLVVLNGEGDYVPFLAESLTPNATLDEWTITLRSGITFHDGSALDATVVKNNIDALRGVYPTRHALFGPALLDNIDSVEATGPDTVVIRTKTPWPALPAALYFGGEFGVMAQSQLDDTESCDRELVGTGPFMLDEWVPNDHLTVVRNPNYWRDGADGAPLPYLDAIEFRPVTEDAQRLNNLRADTIDVAYQNSFGSGLQISQIQDLADDGELRAYMTTDHSDVSYILFNASEAPFDNVNARRAFASALNRDRLGELRYDNVAPAANGPFAPGNVGHVDDTGYPEFDLTAAQDAIASYEADTGSALSFTLSCPADENSAAIAQLLQEMLEAAGASVELHLVDIGQLIDEVIGGGYQASCWQFHVGGDPDAQFAFWHSGSPFNFGKFADQQIDADLESARVEPDPAQRAEVYEDLNRRFGEQVYNAWLYWDVYSVATANDVHGVFGEALPDGSQPCECLVVGHPVAEMWMEG